MMGRKRRGVRRARNAGERRSSADDGDGGGAAISVAAETGRREETSGFESPGANARAGEAREDGANDAMDDGMDARAERRGIRVRNAAGVAEGAE